MPVGWFIVPYGRKTSKITGRPMRYCAMGDHTATIMGSGGYWSEAECLGDRAVVKVRATAPQLTALNAVPGFIRVPKDALDDTLASLTTGQKNALKQLAQDLGYTLAEVNEALPDLNVATVRDVLRLFIKRRIKPRWDVATQNIVFDGPELLPPRTIENLDADVSAI